MGTEEGVARVAEMEVMAGREWARVGAASEGARVATKAAPEVARVAEGRGKWSARCPMHNVCSMCLDTRSPWPWERPLRNTRRFHCSCKHRPLRSRFRKSIHFRSTHTSTSDLAARKVAVRAETVEMVEGWVTAVAA